MSLPERELLRVIAALNGDPNVVMVGGQALYYWYQRYSATNPALKQLSPPTSKDVDFQAPAAVAQRCAERIPGRCKLANFEDGAVSSALVEYTDVDGAEHKIDFVNAPQGLAAREVLEKSAVAFFDVDGVAVPLRIMNPLHCMRSRVANVIELDRTDPHSMNQLTVSIACVRVVFEQLANENVRSALRLAEGVCSLATSRGGLLVFKLHGVDVLASLAGAPEILALPTVFRETRYPRMLAYVRKKRRV